ncbi:type I restriction-modification enzyme R subunit C-terminal domain-containing protein [Streptomyces albus]
MRDLPARGPQRGALRTDEGTRRPHHRPHRAAGRHPGLRRDHPQEPLHPLRRRRRHAVPAGRRQAGGSGGRPTPHRAGEAARQGRHEGHQRRGGRGTRRTACPAQPPAHRRRAGRTPAPGRRHFPDADRESAHARGRRGPPGRDHRNARPGGGPATPRGRPRPPHRQPGPASAHPGDPPRQGLRLRRDERGHQHRPRTGSAAEERARNEIRSWRKFLEQRRDEIAAIEIALSSPRSTSQEEAWTALRSLADEIHRPQYAWTPESLWGYYEDLDIPAPRGNRKADIPDLISLIRYEMGADPDLRLYREQVEERFAGWVLRQQQAGAEFTEEQMWWLKRIRDVIASDVGIGPKDLGGEPFVAKGGGRGFKHAFAEWDVRNLLDELNRELA